MAIQKPGGFMAMMKESVKLFSQNGKLMALVAIIYLFSYSLFFLLNTFSLTPLIYDLMLKIMAITSASPGTPEFTNLLVKIKQDFGLFLGLELAFVLFNSLITVFIMTAIIIISAFSYNGNSLSLKDLSLRVAKSWTRPFVTGWYVGLLSAGYMTFFILPFAIPTLMFFDHHPIVCMSILAVLAIVVIVFLLYLSVFWVLALVVSALEESRGLEALGKARGLVNGHGMRLQGFTLNVIVNLLALFLSQVPNLIIPKQSAVKPLTVGLLQVFLICLLNMFMFVAFTVLYFQCKKNHGEEIKMQGSIVYTEVPTQEEIV